MNAYAQNFFSTLTAIENLEVLEIVGRGLNYSVRFPVAMKFENLKVLRLISGEPMCRTNVAKIILASAINFQEIILDDHLLAKDSTTLVG